MTAACRPWPRRRGPSGWVVPGGEKPIAEKTKEDDACAPSSAFKETRIYFAAASAFLKLRRCGFCTRPFLMALAVTRM